MSDRFNPRCSCAGCRSRGLMAPVVLITVGALFLLQMTTPDWDFGQTWPILLIVIGVVLIVQRLAPRHGHQTYPQLPSDPNSPPS